MSLNGYERTVDDVLDRLGTIDEVWQMSKYDNCTNMRIAQVWQLRKYDKRANDITANETRAGATK